MTTAEFRKTANEILLDYMSKLNVICLSTETDNTVAYLIDRLAIHIDLESLQKPSILTRIGKRLGLCT